MTTPVLVIELVPSTAWGSNLRSLLSAGQWKTCKQFVAARSGQRCELCGGIGPRHPVECHETWSYDDTSHTQTLTGLIALCPPCHRAKHAGFAASQGLLGEVIMHLCEVNDWTLELAELHLQAAFHQYEVRSEHGWHLDTTWLKTIGLPGGYWDREERADMPVIGL